MTQTSFLPPEEPEAVVWTPSHEAAEGRLEHFLSYAISAYARRRNYDLGPEDRSNVSAISPWVRHRLLLEENILQQTLAKRSFKASEKFVQEVFWRGYFKGWLEHRPEVWRRYEHALLGYVDQLETDASLARRYDEAVNGKTGITCFDAWAHELIGTGYLHNHARMWFASIWIFTLALPWELGADFFYRHLLDGDPASNTCSWRWVGGLHTKGKTYLARAANIEQFTDGRFNPLGQLATEAPALSEPELPALIAPLFTAPDLPSPRAGLLITEEDCSPDMLSLPCMPKALFALANPGPRSVLPTGSQAAAFTSAAVQTAAKRCEFSFEQACGICNGFDFEATLAEWTKTENLDCILTARLPTGPVQKRVRKACQSAHIQLIEITRGYDQAVWPHAKRGFFGLKKKLPAILAGIGLD